MFRDIRLTLVKEGRTYSFNLCKTIELPFAPFLGLVIMDKGREFKIDNLCWNNELKKFISFMFDERITSTTKEEWLKFDQGNGWEEC